MVSFYEELHKRDMLSDEKENAQSRASIDKWIFRLFLFLIGVMPLIVMAKVEEVISPLVSNIDVLSSGTKGDLFTQYKALMILIFTIVTGSLLLVKVFFMDGHIRKTKLNYVLGAFVIAILISTVMSPNVSVALNGLYNRADGAISWLCYIALMFIAMNIKYPKNAVRSIMYTMMPFVYINLYIITMNFYSKDLLQNSWMQKLVSIMLPEGASISEGSTLVGTLNQWNYMSGMFAMMTVMYLAWSIVEKSWKVSLVGTITAAASIAVMLMAISTSGFLTVVVILPLIVVLMFKINNRLKSITLFLTFIIVTIPIFDLLAEKDSRVWSESIGFFIDTNPYLNEESATSIKLKPDFNLMSKVYAAESTFELPVLPERSLSFGTGRGYIWEETLKLVKERPLVGYGSDTLVYNFPHYQIESRAGLLDEHTIVDKAHNTYLSILYGMGIFGFIAFVVILIWNVLVYIKTLFGKQSGNQQYLIIGLMILAYSFQALFNDSLPAITSIVFVLLGISFSVLNKETI